MSGAVFSSTQLHDEALLGSSQDLITMVMVESGCGTPSFYGLFMAWKNGGYYN